jgi:hypothetical protein
MSGSCMRRTNTRLDPDTIHRRDTVSTGSPSAVSCQYVHDPGPHHLASRWRVVVNGQQEMIDKDLCVWKFVVLSTPSCREA